MPVSLAAKRHFTLEEANAYLPILEKRLEEMQRLREEIESLEDDIAPVLASAHMNSGGPVAGKFAVALHRLQAHAARIREEGIFLRDVEAGLVDFPAIRFEREIFLCWKLGEGNVQFWHELDGGYAGRKPLDDEDGDEDSDHNSL